MELEAMEDGEDKEIFKDSCKKKWSRFNRACLAHGRTIRGGKESRGGKGEDGKFTPLTPLEKREERIYNARLAQAHDISRIADTVEGILDTMRFEVCFFPRLVYHV